MIEILSLVIGVLGVSAAACILVFTIPRMRRRKHATALWGHSSALGLISIDVLLNPAAIHDPMMAAGDLILVVSSWAIIAVQRVDDRSAK